MASSALKFTEMNINEEPSSHVPIVDSVLTSNPVQVSNLDNNFGQSAFMNSNEDAEDGDEEESNICYFVV
jgi:hypothetical protein